MVLALLFLWLACDVGASSTSVPTSPSMHLLHNGSDSMEQAESVPPQGLPKLGEAHATSGGYQAPADSVDDLDGDGFAVPRDCADFDPEVNPDAVEICGNEQDDDCDHSSGSCARTGALLTSDFEHAIYGEYEDDYVGTSLLLVPDVDGDGTDELVVGGGLGWGARCGGLYVFRGGGARGTTLSDADQIVPDDEHCEIGSGMSWGDFDADGVAEVATASSGGDDHAPYGTSYLEIDQVGTALWSDVAVTISGDDPSSNYDLIDFPAAWQRPMDVDGAILAVGMGPIESGGPLVHLFLPPVVPSDIMDSDASLLSDDTWQRISTMVDVGDLDGDGATSLAVGVSTLELDSGEVTSGVAIIDIMPTSSMLLADVDHRLWGTTESDGDALYPAPSGDVDGDGYGDLIIRDHGGDCGGLAYVGIVEIWHGPIESDLVHNASPIQICGVAEREFFGYSADGSGDLDGDGRTDLIAGQYFSDVGYEGRVNVFYGPLSDGMSVSTSADWTVTGATSRSLAYYGLSGGDWNGDGVDDLVVGGGGDSTVASASGAAFIFYGAGW